MAKKSFFKSQYLGNYSLDEKTSRLFIELATSPEKFEKFAQTFGPGIGTMVGMGIHYFNLAKAICIHADTFADSMDETMHDAWIGTCCKKK